MGKDGFEEGRDLREGGRSAEEGGEEEKGTHSRDGLLTDRCDGIFEGLDEHAKDRVCSLVPHERQSDRPKLQRHVLPLPPQPYEPPLLIQHAQRSLPALDRERLK